MKLLGVIAVNNNSKTNKNTAAPFTIPKSTQRLHLLADVDGVYWAFAAADDATCGATAAPILAAAVMSGPHLPRGRGTLPSAADQVDPTKGPLGGSVIVAAYAAVAANLSVYAE